MRYAVPISGGIMSPHFGHCEQFAFFDFDEGKKEIVRKEIVASPGHQPGFLPRWLAERGVSVVIASGMGPRAQTLFQENKINVVINVLETDPEQAILRHIEGTLEIGDDVCDH